MPKTKPRISVLLPVHNGASFLEEAVASILNQSYGDFELLLLDDGSDAETKEVLHSLRDPRLRLLQNTSCQGLVPSLNSLLAQAKGEYFARMDGDDIAFPNRFALQIALLDDQPDIWLCSGSYTTIGTPPIFTAQMPVEHEVIKAHLLFYSPIPHPFVMFRAAPLRRHAIQYNPKMRHAEDYALWHELVTQYPTARFANVDAVLGLYRRHPGSVSSAKALEQKQNALRACMPSFRALGFSVADKDLAQHLRLQDSTLLSKDDFVAVFGWLLRLYTHNEKQRVFSQAPFRAQLLHQVWQLCERNICLGPLACKHLFSWPDFAALGFSQADQETLLNRAISAQKNCNTKQYKHS